MKNECQEKFDKGMAFRKRTPLHDGKRKIRAAHDRHYKYPDTFHRYGEYSSLSLAKRKIIIPPDRPCMPDEASWYTRKVPGMLCEVLASHVCHAATKLGADGVPTEKVNSLVLWLKLEARKFVDAAEEARLDAKRPWKSRAKELSNREGLLYSLIENFVFITSRLKREAGI